MFPSKTAHERRADFLVHAIGLGFLAPASAFLIAKALPSVGAGKELWLLAAVIVYVLAALFSISISFAYHLLPRHDLRPVLRKWDHAAIYAVIAGAYGPLLIVCGTWSAYAILAVLWLFAIGGVAFKLAGANPDSHWSLISYVGMGLFAFVALPDFWVGLPPMALTLVAAGGAFYMIGVLFYRRKTMRYRYPIWHAVGTFGGLSFFSAIWLAVTA